MPPANKANYPCRGCGVHITNRQVSIQCTVCEFWAHPDCVKISKDYLAVLLSQESGATWTCETCIVVRTKLMKEVTTLYAKLDAMEDRVTTVEDTVVVVTKDVDCVKKDVSKLKEDKTKDLIATKKEIFAELAERNAKKMNIVMHNVNEPDDSIKNGKERKMEDLTTISKIGNVLGLRIDTDKDIKFSARIGPRNDSDTPRPLLVGFREIAAATRDKMLLEARQLRNNSDYSNIGIVPDMTKQQRSEESDMWKEAEVRNSNMDKEESLNYEWRLVGPKGEKRLLKLPRLKESHQPHTQPTRGGRGRGRGKNTNTYQAPRTESRKRKETDNLEEEIPSQKTRH